jgi:hypothetical protein
MAAPDGAQLDLLARPTETCGDVRYWPKADMSYCTAHVRFWGHSGHGRLRESAFAVAIGSKADMGCCTAYVCF